MCLYQNTLSLLDYRHVVLVLLFEKQRMEKTNIISL